MKPGDCQAAVPLYFPHLFGFPSGFWFNSENKSSFITAHTSDNERAYTID